MPDILASAQNQKLLPASQPTDPVLEDVNLPYSARGGNLPPEPEPIPVIPPPVAKKHGNKSLMLAVLLFLLGTLPLAVYFTSQQRQLADLRGRAQQGPYPCGPAGKSCNDVSDCGTNCSSQNWVCVGVIGQKTCQQHGPDLCPGGSCTKVNAYRCDALDSGGQCHQNLRTDVSWSAGVSYAAGCGQVDEVCRSGSRDNLGCGSFEIINTTCGTTAPTPPPGTGTPPPVHTPTPTPPPPGGTGTPPPSTPTPLPAGPQCRNIKLYKNSEVILPSALLPGDQITIAVVGANATKARARVNGSAWTETTTKNTAGEFTIQFTVPSSGGTFTIEAEVHQNGMWQ